MLQAVLRQPRIGDLDGALDMIGGSREIIGRSHQRAQRRHHEIFDAGSEIFQFADQLPRDQQRQRMQRIGDRADRRRCVAQAYPVGRTIRRRAPFATATLTGVLEEIAPSAR